MNETEHPGIGRRCQERIALCRISVADVEWIVRTKTESHAVSRGVEYIWRQGVACWGLLESAVL
ncbi:MAG: hypothetical protein ABGZ17_19165, partial [Planctomycetaceae bacterium]